MSKKANLAKNLIGQRFGQLTVIDFVLDNNNRQKCVCQCDCGNDTLATPSALKTNHKQSCGCSKSKQNKYTYLIGEKINKWTVTELQLVNKTYKAVCHCECGTVKSINIYNLINGRSKDCGCGRKQGLSSKKSSDLLGLRFGKLLVTDMLPESNKFKRRMYMCECDCGNTVIVSSSSLTTGHTNSCGCLLSYYNMYIDKLLTDLQIDHQTEYTVKIKNHNLRFDFYLPAFNTFIEYDGEQHYMPVDFGYADATVAEQRFITIQQYDQLKNEHCSNNNINLLRIPYWEKKNIKQIISNHLQRLSEKDVIDK